MSNVKIARFKELKLWSFALQETKSISSKFALSTLRDVLINLTNERKFTINENAFYNEPTISSKTNEISVSRQGYGKIFKVKQRVQILKGDLVISKMHTQNGLFAFAKQEFASTTTFIPFKIKTDLIKPDFLFMLLRSTLARLVKFDSVKRETYKVDEILDLQIPLPPLSIQNKIIDGLKQIENKIKALQNKKAKLENQINAYICSLDTNYGNGIKIVWYKNLTRWDIKNYIGDIKSNFPLISLRNLIFENKNKIKPFLYQNDDFDILGVNNKDGVFFNQTLKGSQIRQPYIKVKSNDIFYNPYRVNVGSIGIVPNEFDGKFTSPAYVVFRVDENQLCSKFLLLILKSPSFNKYLRSHTIGSVRQILSFKSLQNLKIPLPLLSTQNQIIDDLQAIENKVKFLQEKKVKFINETNAYIYV